MRYYEEPEEWAEYQREKIAEEYGNIFRKIEEEHNYNRRAQREGSGIEAIVFVGVIGFLWLICSVLSNIFF